MKTYKQFIIESTRRRGERYDSSQGFDYYSKNPNLSIKRKRSGMQTSITDKTSGVTFKIGHGDPKYSKYTDPDLQNTIHSNKPTHEISWSHSKSREELTPAQRFGMARAALRTYKNEIQPRIPSGHIVSSVPQSNPSPINPDKNTRSRAAERADFGKRGPTKSKQYSVKIGNRFLPINNL